MCNVDWALSEEIVLDRISFEAFYRIFFFYCFFDGFYALLLLFVCTLYYYFHVFRKLIFCMIVQVIIGVEFYCFFVWFCCFFLGGGYIYYCFVFTISRVFWGLFFLYEDWVNIIRVVEWNWLLWWCHISAWYLTRVWTMDYSRFYETIKSTDQFLFLINI